MFAFLRLKKQIKISVSVMALVVMFATNAGAVATGTGAVQSVCRTALGGGSSVTRIAMAQFQTISNMLPISMGPTKVGGENTGDGSNTGGNLICQCIRIPSMPPIPGITVGWWNPTGTVETTSIPYCFPGLGNPIDMQISNKSFGTRSDGKKGEYATAQSHYLTTLNVVKTLSDTLASGCLSWSMSSGIDYISELLVWRQNDYWSIIFAPESLLVANPIAAAACLVDSIAALIRHPLDVLFWCYGSWGSAYPMTINVGSGDVLTAFAALAARTLTIMSQNMKILKIKGQHMLSATCQPYPTYFLLKNEVHIYPIFPFVNRKRFPIGYPAIIWGVGVDNPTNMGVMSWMVYQQRDCCYL